MFSARRRSIAIAFTNLVVPSYRVSPVRRLLYRVIPCLVFLARNRYPYHTTNCKRQERVVVMLFELLSHGHKGPISSAANACDERTMIANPIHGIRNAERDTLSDTVIAVIGAGAAAGAVVNRDCNDRRVCGWRVVLMSAEIIGLCTETRPKPIPSSRASSAPTRWWPFHARSSSYSLSS